MKTQTIDPETVDLRVVVGQPKGSQPVKILCPMHDDKVGSLAVYRSNINCFACSFHIARRYAALAFLLGKWDGKGNENSERVAEAVRQVKAQGLERYVHGKDDDPSTVPAVQPPLSSFVVESFHQYLLRYASRRVMDELIVGRGLSMETIKRYRIGYTGTHYTIPVAGLDGGWYTIRYRADDRYSEGDKGKYTGMYGRNEPVLFPLQTVVGLDHVDELIVVEGEYDALAVVQTGATSLTVTNGSLNCAKIVELVELSLPVIHVKRWVVAFDQDAAGEKAADKVLACLTERGETGVRARWDKYKDIGELLASGVNLREGVRYDR